MSESGDLELNEGTTTTRRTTRNGRGKKVVTTRQEFVDDEDESPSLPGLFALSEIEENSIVRVRVYRKDPDEGMLGYMEDPNVTEDEIKQRWGGSQYRLEGLNNIGKIVAARTVRIAGDPLFVSHTFRANWEKTHGITGTANPAPQGMGIQDMLTFMREQETIRQQNEAARIAREAEERRNHEERMRRLELEAEERRRKDEREREERKAREDREREEARRRDEADREERRRKEAKDAEDRQRQHTEQMLTMMRASNEQAMGMLKLQATQTPQNNLMDAVKVIATIKEAFGGEAPNPENDDPLTLLMKHGGEWLSGIGNAAQAVIREVKGAPAAPQVAGQPSSPQLPAAQPEGLVIPASSPLAGKLQKLVGDMAAKGLNPEVALSQVMDQVQSNLNQMGQPPATPPAPPAAPQPPQSGEIVTPPPAPAQTAATPTQPPTVPPAAPRTAVKSEKTTHGSVRLSFN